MFICHEEHTHQNINNRTTLFTNSVCRKHVEPVHICVFRYDDFSQLVRSKAHRNATQSAD